MARQGREHPPPHRVREGAVFDPGGHGLERRAIFPRTSTHAFPIFFASDFSAELANIGRRSARSKERRRSRRL